MLCKVNECANALQSRGADAVNQAPALASALSHHGLSHEALCQECCSAHALPPCHHLIQDALQLSTGETTSCTQPATEVLQ